MILSLSPSALACPGRFKIAPLRQRILISAIPAADNHSLPCSTFWIRADRSAWTLD